MSKSRALNGDSIPAGLGKSGQSLWKRIQNEYGIEDVGGRELLYQAACGVDLAERCAEAIKRDGLVIATKSGPRSNPLIREEMSARAFVCRTLSKLGVTNEPVKPVGRPPSDGVGVSYERLRRQ